MKKLLIVESPAKTKTIAKFLGKEFKIMSTMGHVKDLPQKELGITLNDTVHIEYVVLDDKDKVIAAICKEAQTADEIFLAPDPDREGEIIAWHIGQEVEKVARAKHKIHRISFNEITKPAIEAALDQPSVIDMHKVAAQQARRVLDRWVGYEVSPILWQKITKGLSAGRVQSVALKLICERELAIREFKPQEYWTIDGIFTGLEQELIAPLIQVKHKKVDITSEQQAQKLCTAIKEAPSFSIESIKDSKRLKNPAAPFITSTLQQAAYNRLSFSVQKTMMLAQSLYEGLPLQDNTTPVALITYMRTDSYRISEIALTSARTFITTQYGKEYVPPKPQVYTKGKTQDAHEAIRPIDITITPEFVYKHASTDIARLYELIWQRFIASQIKPAQYAQRQVTIEDTARIFTFRITGSTLLFDGFLKVYGLDDDEKEEKIILPKELAVKQQLTLKQLASKQHFTQPPARYTEASLVKELEKEGIGRPSTYATILKTIQARSYTALDTKKRFVPTELGMAVTTMLNENLPKIMNVKFTALMEEDLDKIAQGQLDRDELLKAFYSAFSKDLELFRGSVAKRQPEVTNITCPRCHQGKLAIRFGKAGEFLGCTRFPECTFTSNFERTETGEIKLISAEEPKLLELICPQCSKPLRQLIGRFGPFIACSGYPECTYIHHTKANFPCPKCQGDIIERQWKGKKFWGCKNYPQCTFSIAGDIEQQPCPSCKAPFLLKRTQSGGNVRLICHNKQCAFEQDVSE